MPCFSDRLAAKLARKESLSMKLAQRPGRQELIDRNILYQMSDEERRLDRSIIGAKLIRRLSLRPTAEELEEKNILKSKLAKKMYADMRILEWNRWWVLKNSILSFNNVYFILLLQEVQTPNILSICNGKK